MKPAKSFTDLIVWQKAHQFVLRVYETSARFPKHEQCGVTSQLRRAAVSVPANIAEGFRRRGRTDKVRFMNIAQSSLEEARYYLLPANDLGYEVAKHVGDQAEEVSKLLDGYTSAILSSGS